MAFFGLINRKPDPFKTAVAEMLVTQRAMKHDISLIRSQMAQLTFADVQAEINKLVNDNTASNNAIAAQLQETQRLLTDFGNRAAQGDAPSQAEYQSAIAQLQATHSLVQQNTASVQASTQTIKDADPAQSDSGSSSQSSQSGPTNTGGTDSTSVNMGNAGASSQVGGGLEPGTGAVDQSGHESTQV